MISPRMMELLEKTADAFEVYECVDLSELIGKILRDYWISHKEEGGNQ